MPVRGPDVVEVVVLAADAHALLHRRRAAIVPLLLAEEDVLELVHPGVREEQRRIVGRHERRRGDDAVAARREEIEETLANLASGERGGRGHGGIVPRQSSGSGSSRLEDLRDRVGGEAAPQQMLKQPSARGQVGIGGRAPGDEDLADGGLFVLRRDVAQQVARQRLVDAARARARARCDGGRAPLTRSAVRTCAPAARRSSSGHRGRSAATTCRRRRPCSRDRGAWRVISAVVYSRRAAERAAMRARPGRAHQARARGVATGTVQFSGRLVAEAMDVRRVFRWRRAAGRADGDERRLAVGSERVAALPGVMPRRRILNSSTLVTQRSASSMLTALPGRASGSPGRTSACRTASRPGRSRRR